MRGRWRAVDRLFVAGRASFKTCATYRSRKRRPVVTRGSRGRSSRRSWRGLRVEDEGARCQLLFPETRARRLSRDVGACETKHVVAPRDHASRGLARDIRTRSGSVAYLPERLDPTLRVADWADRLSDSREKDPGAQSATDAARNDVWSSLATDETACFDAVNAVGACLSTERAKRGLVSTDARAREPRKPVAATRLAMTGHLSRDGVCSVWARVSKKIGPRAAGRKISAWGGTPIALSSHSAARSAARASLLGVERYFVAR